MNATLLYGDARSVLRRLPEGIVRTCITSPPYFGLRDYGLPPLVWGGDSACEHQWVDATVVNSRLNDDTAGSKQRTNQGSFLSGDRRVRPADSCICCGAWRGSLGLEPTPSLYVEHLVDVLREVRRVLSDDATLWLNLGDSYCNAGSRNNGTGLDGKRRGGMQDTDGSWESAKASYRDLRHALGESGIKTKDLIGIPWMVAFALRSDGWYLRSDIIWAKGNPMPESVEDRPTRAHEYLFLLSKSSRYYYDHKAVREPEAATSTARYKYAADDGRINKSGAYREAYSGEDDHGLQARAVTGLPQIPTDGMRNKRTIWTINTKPFKGAHFAVFPPALVEPCVLAGSEEGDLVLDPFCGSGTTGEVALKHGRGFIGVDLNPAYLELARMRLEAVAS